MNAKELRTDIGMEILEKMQANDDLPLPNIRRLSKVMMEYFITDGYKDILKEEGYKWLASQDYWINHLTEIRQALRDKGKYFEYYREQGELKGRWSFVGKKEFEEIMLREYADIGTRTGTYNERLEDGLEKWALNAPRIQDVPLLEDK